MPHLGVDFLFRFIHLIFHQFIDKLMEDAINGFKKLKVVSDLNPVSRASRVRYQLKYDLYSPSPLTWEIVKCK